MADKKRGNNFLQFGLIFASVYLLVTVTQQLFFPQKVEEQPGLLFTSISHSYTVGHHPVLNMQNRAVSVESHGMLGWVGSKFCSLKRTITGSPSAEDCSAMYQKATGPTLTIPTRCPMPPVDVFRVEGSGSGEKLVPLNTTQTVVPCEPVPPIMAGQSAQVSLAPWKYSMFDPLGTYEVRFTVPPAFRQGSGSTIPATLTARFAMVEPNSFTKLFRTFITAPFLNILIFVASIAPGHNLGIAIIILTLLVKLLLFFPTQKAMEGQKKMQILQPKIEALKKQYGDDQQRLHTETMKLWKEHKINPFSACLPTLLQFPVLIGLFYVIRDGSTLELSKHLIYPFYQNLSWHFGTNFLGLDLLKPNIWLLPVLLVALQFMQMKLAFAITKRKQAKAGGVIDVSKDKPTEKASAQDTQQKVMLYMLPLMIGFFALRFPAAVAIYWGVSTLFAIGQQMIVNREHLRV